MCEEWARDVFCIGNVLSDRIDAGEEDYDPSRDGSVLLLPRALPMRDLQKGPIR